LTKEVVGANALVTPKNGYIPVRLLTGTKSPIKIYRDTKIGYIEPLINDTQGLKFRSIQLEKLPQDLRPENILSHFREQLNRMSPADAKVMSEILLDYHDIFSRNRMDIGCSNVKHTIDTGDSPPIAWNPRRMPQAVEDKVDDLVVKLLEQQIIRPSESAWNSPIVVVKKKNGDIRMCIDYRKLNSVTSRPVFPMPDAKQLFDTLDGAQYFSSLDLSQGYYQVPMDEKDVSKTAFATRKGQYEFLRMPFGLCSAPATL
jgi:hypothetical protein